MKRTRAGTTRYSRDRVKELRAEIAKSPNPIYAQMVDKGQMTDADMIDFAVSMSCSYFSGELLEKFKETAAFNMDLQTRRAVLVTAAFFGATAEFDKDGGMRIRRLGVDSDLATFAVQQLVNAGFSVAEALRQLEPPPPAPCEMESDIQTQLPARVM